MDSSGTSILKIGTEFFYKAFRVLAILMIVGVILPIITPSFNGNSLMFVNFQLFAGEGVSFWIRLGAIYPLLAGAAILFLLRKPQLTETNMAISILAISVIPILFFKSAFLEGFDSGTMGSVFQSSTLFVLGITLILIAGLIVRSGNLTLVPKIIGAAGGFFYILYLFIPIQIGGGLFGFEQMPIASFFDMVGMGNSPAGAMNIMGISLVISAGFLVAASIFCFLLFNLKYDNDTTGKKITLYWMWSQIAILAGILYSIVTSLTDFSAFIMVLLMSLKLVIMLYSVMLLVVFSTAYLLTLLPQSELKPSRAFSMPGGFSINDPIDIESKIEKLKQLYDKGLITDEEYQTKKKEYLDLL